MFHSETRDFSSFQVFNIQNDLLLLASWSFAKNVVQKTSTIKLETDFPNIPVWELALEIMLTHREQDLQNLSHFPVVLMGCIHSLPWEPMPDNSEAVVLTKDATTCQEIVAKLTGLLGSRLLRLLDCKGDVE